jgi:hypothetical protein
LFERSLGFCACLLNGFSRKLGVGVIKIEYDGCDKWYLERLFVGTESGKQMVSLSLKSQLIQLAQQHIHLDHKINSPVFDTTIGIGTIDEYPRDFLCIVCWRRSLKFGGLIT